MVTLLKKVWEGKELLYISTGFVDSKVLNAVVSLTWNRILLTAPYSRICCWIPLF